MQFVIRVFFIWYMEIIRNFVMRGVLLEVIGMLLEIIRMMNDRVKKDLIIRVICLLIFGGRINVSIVSEVIIKQGMMILQRKNLGL